MRLTMGDHEDRLSLLRGELRAEERCRADDERYLAQLETELSRLEQGG